MYLAFYTQTTDLPRSHLAHAHPLQPHLLHFAAIAFDGDGCETDRLFTLVKPVRPFLVSESVASCKTRGHLLEQAVALGMEPSEVFYWFAAKTRTANRITGPNVFFDMLIMSILSARLTGRAWEPPCPVSHMMPIEQAYRDQGQTASTPR